MLFLFLRHVAMPGGCSVLLAGALLLFASAASASPPYDTFPDDIARLEARYGGRLGVALLRTRDDTLYTHRGDELFPMCSTFKVVAVANLLKLSERDPALLDTRLRVDGQRIMPYSQVIKKYIKTGITLREVGEACLVMSDNTAANLLIDWLGGPAAVTAFARSIGDPVFRIDRREIEMNESAPGDERDTTSPVAMVETLYDIALGNVLAPPQRATFVRWMRNSKTGYRRLRAGTPKSWTVADKTGTGEYGTTNAVGILWPPQGPPLVIAVFYTREDVDAEPNNDILAAVARLATRAGGTP